MLSKFILALRGPGNTGKSTTIHLLYKLMNMSGFNDIEGNFGKFKDFWCVFEKGGKKIGITSLGDSYSVLSHKLDILNQAGCEVIVCACRTSGQTIELLEEKLAFKVEYFEKTRAGALSETEANKNDASALLNRIKQLI